MSWRAIVAGLAALALSAAPARADWTGDGHADLLAQSPAGALLLYRGNGAGGWITGSGEQIGCCGWTFPTLLFPGDFSGDGRPDVLAVDSGGRLIMYRGDGAGGFAQGTAQQVGSGWTFTYVLAPGDFSGDGRPDLLAVDAQGRMLMYRGDGDGGWITGRGEQIGQGWGGFTAVLAGGDFSGDGQPDVLARTSDGRLLLYRGNGAGGWITGTGEQIGQGWGGFTALLGGGDFDGDGKPDVLARTSDGRLLLYRGNGAGGWITGTGQQIGEGWGSLSGLALVPGAPPAPPPPPPAPPVAPVPGAQVQVKAGTHCTPAGRKMRVTLRVRRVAGRAAAHVRLVVFYVPGGSRRVDHHRPYVVHLRMNQPAGDRGHVYARVYFTRGGSGRLRHRTVSRRFRICG